MDGETERKIAALILAEAERLKARAAEEGVLAYVRPQKRYRPNPLFLKNTIQSVESMNRNLDIQEMWEQRQRELVKGNSGGRGRREGAWARDSDPGRDICRRGTEGPRFQEQSGDHGRRSGEPDSVKDNRGRSPSPVRREQTSEPVEWRLQERDLESQLHEPNSSSEGRRRSSSAQMKEVEKQLRERALSSLRQRRAEAACRNPGASSVCRPDTGPQREFRSRRSEVERIRGGHGSGYGENRNREANGGDDHWNPDEGPGDVVLEGSERWRRGDGAGGFQVGGRLPTSLPGEDAWKRHSAGSFLPLQDVETDLRERRRGNSVTGSGAGVSEEEDQAVNLENAVPEEQVLRDSVRELREPQGEACGGSREALEDTELRSFLLSKTKRGRGSVGPHMDKAGGISQAGGKGPVPGPAGTLVGLLMERVREEWEERVGTVTAAGASASWPRGQSVEERGLTWGDQEVKHGDSVSTLSFSSSSSSSSSSEDEDERRRRRRKEKRKRRELSSAEKRKGSRKKKSKSKKDKKKSKKSQKGRGAD